MSSAYSLAPVDVPAFSCENALHPPREIDAVKGHQGEDKGGIVSTEERWHFADDVFRQAMKEVKIGSFRTWQIYHALHLGGKNAFYSRDCPQFRANPA